MLKATLTASIRKSIQESGFLPMLTKGGRHDPRNTSRGCETRHRRSFLIDVGRGRKYELEFERFARSTRSRTAR